MVTTDKLQLSLPISHVGSEAVSLLGDPSNLSVSVYLKAALATNTRRAYCSDLKDFINWGGTVPADPNMIAAYIADRASLHSPHTIARRMVGISHAHTTLGFVSPVANVLIRNLMRGVRRVHGRPQRQARPLLRENLTDIDAGMKGVRGLRDRAMILLGFAAALRRTELVALDVDDLSFSSDGVLLHIRRSKTDQSSNGRRIAVPHGRTKLCPVDAVAQWLDASGIESGAVFRRLSKGGVIGNRLSSQSVALVLKLRMEASGISSADYSGHSLRSGFVTSAAQAGAAIHKIQAQTGHSSLTMLSRYIRDARLFKDNACAAVL